MRIEDKVKKLSTEEQKEFFKKLDLAEGVLNFWFIVDETIKRYKNKKAKHQALSEWLAFLEVDHGSFAGITKWNKISIYDIYAFKEFLSKKPGARAGETRAETVIESNLSTIKKISQRLFHMGLLKNCDILDFKIKNKVSRPNKAPRINDSDIEKLLNYFDITKLISRRDRAMVAVLAGGALRISEVVKLRIKHVKRTDKGTVYLTLFKTKTGEDFLQPVYGKFGQIIYDFAKEISALDGSDEGYLFRCYAKSPETHLNTLSGRVMFKRAAEKIDFPTTKTHAFRVTTITKLLENKMPLQDVQKFSRHASITTVLLYDRTKLTVDELAERVLENS